MDAHRHLTTMMTESYILPRLTGYATKNHANFGFLREIPSFHQ